MTGAARLRLGPRAGWAFLVLFAVSTAFPVVASLLPPPGTSLALGALDVLVAAVIVGLGFAIENAARNRVPGDESRVAWQVVRILATVPLLLLVVFFVRSDILRWDVLLVGLAWRTWLILWVLPSVVAILRSGGPS